MHHFVQHTVDPEPDAQILFRRLDMDVRRPVPDRLTDHQVDELDDRGILDELVDPRGIDVLGELGGRFRGHLIDLAVEAVDPVDQRMDLRRRRHHHHDLGAGHGANVVGGKDVGRVGHRDDEAALFVPLDRDRLVAPHQ